MRKRLMNISKRCMVAIMSAAMLMSSVTVSMAFPVGVYAEDNNTSGITITSGQEIQTNYGDNIENRGHIEYNRGDNVLNSVGTIENNYGDNVEVGTNELYLSTDGLVTRNYGNVSVINSSGNVVSNQETGSVGINRGLIDNNWNSVDENCGVITNNMGDVVLNSGTISSHVTGNIGTNSVSGTVNGSNNGTNQQVTNNFGTVTGTATVTNNYGGIVAQTVSVTNQFYSVNFIAPEDGTISYGTGFTAKNDNEYVQVTGTNAQAGVITISPAQGKEIIGEEKTNEDGVADATFTYSLVKQNDGSFKLTITPNGNITNLGIGLLGLAIQTIQQNENVPITSVVIQDIENSNDNTSNNSGDQAQDSSSVFSLTNFMQNSLMTGQTGRNIIDFKTNTCLTTDGMEYLLSKNNATDCYFDYEGARYVLHIPASSGIDPQKKNAAFEALKKEYGGMAGFMTIAILFKECGVWFEEIPQQAIANTVAAPGVAPAQNVAAPALASVMTAFVDPASMDEADYTEKMVSMIAGALYGGTIELNTNDSAYLNESIISSLEARRDVALRMKATVNEVPYVISIPAGYNLRALEDKNGKIDMQKLIDTFVNARR